MDAGERERVYQVFLVGLAGGGEVLVVAQVVIPVRHSEPGLEQADDVGLRILLVDFDVQLERAVRVVGRRGDVRRHVGERLQACDAGQFRLCRREARGLDRRGVDEGGIQVAQLAPFGAQVRVRRREQLGDDRLELRLVALVEFEIDAGELPIRRNRGGPEPAAVGVAKEIHPRWRSGIEVVQRQPPRRERDRSGEQYGGCAHSHRGTDASFHADSG